LKSSERVFDGGVTAAQRREGFQETTVELPGRVDGWQGQSPDEIAGKTNPTLQTVAGQTYTVTWESGDGEPPDGQRLSPPMELAASVLRDDALDPENILEQVTVAWDDIAPNGRSSTRAGAVQTGFSLDKSSLLRFPERRTSYTTTLMA
jgi:hypothetical protein